MSEIIEIYYSFEKGRPLGWHKFFSELEEKMIIELSKKGINPDEVLFRGIAFSDFNRLVNTGYDLPLRFNFYAGALRDGHHTIRTALEYANMKCSKPFFFRQSKNQFIVTCYRKNLFDKNEFIEKSGYQNYNWILRSEYSYRDALLIIFLFKPIL